MHNDLTFISWSAYERTLTLIYYCRYLTYGDHDSPESRSLAQQNVDLRRRLDEEQASYRRKLTAYQEGQQRQAQLVQKLQAKVLQYKKRCGDLEQMLETSNGGHQDESSSNLEDALIRLEEEQQRSSSLSAVNAMLREQLEQAGLANEALSQDIRRLTADWTKAREELEQKESDWRREEESFHSYFSSEHSRLLMLWRQVVGFRRHVCELKSATERDLSDMRNELARVSHSSQVSCAGLSAALQSREGGAALALEREKALRVQLEQQLKERVAEMMNLQTRTDAERSELNVRSVTVWTSLTDLSWLPRCISVRNVQSETSQLLKCPTDKTLSILNPFTFGFWINLVTIALCVVREVF
uniref:Ciliary rootlet coiled-coil, rootletin n=1 Tax=Seriola lalandi dorsalis TaxID=1841481 RepID=A0A3B4YPM5_SERLL